MSDPSRSPLAELASDAVTAEMLGRSLPWFRKNRDRLERLHGFPKKDAVIGLRSKEAIRRWLNREIRQKVRKPSTEERENLDAFS